MRIEDVDGREFLAKGKRGVVYTGMFNGRKVAIKTKRKESLAMNRIENETNFLKKLNKYKIGPEYIDSGEGFLVYVFVEGDFIIDYIEKNDKKEILKVLKDIFRQMFVMDNLGINKEEMHHPVKHVIVGEKVVMIDFERCSYTEKPKNVTQFVQFILGSKLLPLLLEKGIELDREVMRLLAYHYKKERTEENYEKILGELK